MIGFVGYFVIGISGVLLFLVGGSRLFLVVGVVGMVVLFVGILMFNWLMIEVLVVLCVVRMVSVMDV